MEKVEQTKHKLKTGQAGKFYKDIAIYLDDLEPLAISTIVLKVVFDRVFSTQRGANLITPTLVAIGSALESECKFRMMRRETTPGNTRMDKNDIFFMASCRESSL